MQRIPTALLLTIALVATLGAHDVGAQVTDRQIQDAEATLEDATRSLNTLLAQRTLEEVQTPRDSLQAVQDSVFASLGGEVLIDTVNVLYETTYVQVDVPYSEWDRLTQREWAVRLERSRVKHIATETAGRYRVRGDRDSAFKAVLISFLEPDVGGI